MFHDRLGHEAGAQRAMFHDGHLLIILHEVPEPGDPERTGLFFWRNPDGVWKTSARGAGFSAITSLLDRYGRQVDVLEAGADKADEIDALFEVLRHVSPLRRAANNLAKALQQAREAVGGRDLIGQRDRAFELVRGCELVMQDAKHALDYAMARQAEVQAHADRQTARAAERLNHLAAIFLPLTLVASLFGMNLPSGLETTSVAPFWAVVAGGLLVGFIVGQLIARRRKPRAETKEGRSAIRGALLRPRTS